MSDRERRSQPGCSHRCAPCVCCQEFFERTHRPLPRKSSPTFKGTVIVPSFCRTEFAVESHTTGIDDWDLESSSELLAHFDGAEKSPVGNHRFSSCRPDNDHGSVSGLDLPLTPLSRPSNTNTHGRPFGKSNLRNRRCPMTSAWQPPRRPETRLEPTDRHDPLTLCFCSGIHCHRKFRRSCPVPGPRMGGNHPATRSSEFADPTLGVPDADRPVGARTVHPFGDQRWIGRERL